jgi:hypothetical protein
MAVCYNKDKRPDCRGVYRGFSQALQCQDVKPTADTSQIIPSTSFPLRQKLNFITFDATFLKLSTSSLNKPQTNQ